MFKNRSIDSSKPAFCDSAAFLRMERADPRFLETYARYVEAQTYEEEYLLDARRKIDVVAEAVRACVAKDGRMGACVDASGMVGRMLDRLEVWNYVAKATLTITFGTSEHEPEYFWVLDEGHFVASHAIVVAPPYGVVDVTIKQQPYPPEKRALLPDIVLGDHFDLSTWEADDLASPDVQIAALQAGFRRFADYVRRTNPQMLEVMEALPPRVLTMENLALKYVPVAVGGFTEPLEELFGYKPCGKTALELFESDVVPRLGP